MNASLHFFHDTFWSNFKVFVWANGTPLLHFLVPPYFRHITTIARDDEFPPQVVDQGYIQRRDSSLKLNYCDNEQCKEQSQP